MAQWVLELRRSAAAVVGWVAAANSGGGCYAIVGSGTNQITVVRADANGAITWQREYTLPAGGTPSEIAIACNGVYVAIAVRDTTVADTVYVARLNQTDGTITWQTSLPFQIDNYESVSLTKVLAVGPTGAVYIAGKLTGTTTAHRLCKLAAADGTITWAINPLDSATAAFANGVRQVEVDSAGNAIVSFIAENPNAQAVYKFANADGTLTWARKFAFPVAVLWTLCAVDPTDNVYVAGWGSGAVDNLYVIKLSSAGAETWDQTITLTDTGSTVLCGSMAADATNVYLGSYLAGASSMRSVIIKMPAAGNAVSAVGFITPTAAYQDGMESVTAAGGGVYGASYDQVATFNRAAIYRYDPATSDAADFGAYDRIGVGYSLAAGTTTVTTITPTMPANPTVTPSSVTMTDAAGSLLSTLYEEVIIPPVIRFAHSLFPAAQFGTPRWVRAYPATSIAPAAQFGTPTYDINLETYAVGLNNANQFGQAYAFQYVNASGVHNAQALLPTSQFGTPAATPTFQGQASSLGPETVFGTPLLRLRQGAVGFLSGGVFGIPAMRSRFAAASFRSTAFGAPTLLGIHVAAGFINTAFGAPATEASGAFAASGVTSTQFGTPTMLPIYHAAALFNRSRFGVSRVLRPC